MLDSRCGQISDCLDSVPLFKGFLDHLDSHTPDHGGLPLAGLAPPYISNFSNQQIRGFILELDCSWDVIVEDRFGSSARKMKKFARWHLVEALLLASKNFRDWDQITAVAGLSAFVKNVGSGEHLHPIYFGRISELLDFILASKVRFPTEGKFEILRGKIGLHFKRFEGGDAVMRQVSELFGIPHTTFRKLPDAPFDEPKFLQFLGMLHERRTTAWNTKGFHVALVREADFSERSDLSDKLADLERRYRMWEDDYGSCCWYEIFVPKSVGTVPVVLTGLAKSLRTREPSTSWFRHARKAIQQGQLAWPEIERLLSGLGTYEFAKRSESLWKGAKPALYLHALYRHHHGGTDPLGAARLVKRKLKAICEDGLAEDPHVGPNRSGTYRNPLTLSKENSAIVKAACWCLSLFEEKNAAPRLGDVALALGLRFEDPSKGSYLRSLAGSTAAIRSLQSMRNPAAIDELERCRSQIEDSRLMALF